MTGPPLCATLAPMPPLHPASDFQDDGGTPSWRRRHAAPIIDASPDTFRGRWRRLPFWQQAMVVVFVGWPLPFIILFGGIIALALFDAVRSLF